MIETEASTIQVEELTNIRIAEIESGYSATLVDKDGFEIVRGYGETVTEALNDLHSNLI